jgi:CheY-like chemotaxis protein
VVSDMVKNIMVVDDDPDQIITVKQILEGLDGGYEVIGAQDGMECLELLENKMVPDLILLDIMMPEMSGWEVFDKLKENPFWKGIPVIFITAYSDELTKKSDDFLAEDFIVKPYEIHELKDKIDKVLEETQCPC